MHFHHSSVHDQQRNRSLSSACYHDTHPLSATAGGEVQNWTQKVFDIQIQFSESKQNLIDAANKM